jgi:hypothetical protein
MYQRRFSRTHNQKDVSVAGLSTLELEEKSSAVTTKKRLMNEARSKAERAQRDPARDTVQMMKSNKILHEKRGNNHDAFKFGALYRGPSQQHV